MKHIYTFLCLFLLGTTAIADSWPESDEEPLLAEIGHRSFKISRGWMMPTLLIGDVVLTSLEVVEPNRGDIIVFEYPHDRSEFFIFRVVGIPGDMIDYQDKTLIVNKVEFSRIPSQDYVFPRHTISAYFEFQPNAAYSIFLDTNLESSDMVGVTVPPDHYFVMGDNRDHSNDSRFWGFVPKSHLRGIYRLTLPTITRGLDEMAKAYEEPSSSAYAGENYCEWLYEYVRELQVGNLTIIKGCKGEHCAGVKDDTNRFYIGLDPPITLKASKPFTFYSNLETVDLIARYSPGFMVKPTAQQIVIRDRGEYIIEKIVRDRFGYCPQTGTPLKVGDKIDTPIDIGEGSMVVKHKGRLVYFGESGVYEPDAPHGIACFRTGNCEHLKLKVTREAKIEDWMTLEMDGVVGFTMDRPFRNAHYYSFALQNQ